MAEIEFPQCRLGHRRLAHTSRPAVADEWLCRGSLQDLSVAPIAC
jgi:hypothetical protein